MHRLNNNIVKKENEMSNGNEQVQQPVQVEVVTRKSTTNTLAIVSIVFAVLGIFLTWVIPFLSQIIAIITGHVARSQIRKSEEVQEGDGMALAGLIIGYIMIVLGLIPIIFIGGLAAYAS